MDPASLAHYPRLARRGRGIREDIPGSSPLSQDDTSLPGQNYRAAARYHTGYACTGFEARSLCPSGLSTDPVPEVVAEAGTSTWALCPGQLSPPTMFDCTFQPMLDSSSRHVVRTETISGGYHAVPVPCRAGRAPLMVEDRGSLQSAVLYAYSAASSALCTAGRLLVPTCRS